MKVGFIGLGVMGKPMASRLLDAGHELFLHSRKPAASELLEKGGRDCRSGKEVASQSDVIVIMVPDTPDVENVLFGEGGVSDGLSGGAVVVDMSSISPIATKSFAERIAGLGCDYLDAPVSGGETGAKQGTLSIMVGGPERAFLKVKPLFEVMGKNISLVGANGDGQTAKIANQIIVAATIEAISEALLFAAKAGADPGKVRKALIGGFASSRVLEVHGERIINRNFQPGFRIELHQKDLKLALEGARSLKMSLPNTASCQQLFNACVARGGGSWDHSAMVRALEQLANYEIGFEPTR